MSGEDLRESDLDLSSLDGDHPKNNHFDDHHYPPDEHHEQYPPDGWEEDYEEPYDWKENHEHQGGRGNFGHHRFNFRGRGRFVNRRQVRGGWRRGWRPRYRGRGNFIIQQNYYQDKKVNYRHEEVEQYRQMYTKYFSSVAEREGHPGRGDGDGRRRNDNDVADAREGREVPGGYRSRSREFDDGKEHFDHRKEKGDMRSLKNKDHRMDEDYDVDEPQRERSGGDYRHEREGGFRMRKNVIGRKSRRFSPERGESLENRIRVGRTETAEKSRPSGNGPSRYSDRCSGGRKTSEAVRESDEDDGRRARDTVRSRLFRARKTGPDDRKTRIRDHEDDDDDDDDESPDKRNSEGKLYSDRTKLDIKERISGKRGMIRRGGSDRGHGGMHFEGPPRRNDTSDDGDHHDDWEFQNVKIKKEKIDGRRRERDPSRERGESRSPPRPRNFGRERSPAPVSKSIKRAREFEEARRKLRDVEEPDVESDESGAREYRIWKRENEAKNKAKDSKKKRKDRDSSVDSAKKKKKKKKKKKDE